MDETTTTGAGSEWNSLHREGEGLGRTCLVGKFDCGLPSCIIFYLLRFHFCSMFVCLSYGGHFESQENSKLRFYPSSLTLNARLAVQHLQA